MVLSLIDLEALQSVALAVAEERSVDRVLASVVRGLARQPDVALARVWLLGPGDQCTRCPMRSECPDQSRCLHLVASAGTPLGAEEDWSRLDGSFRRFPLGVRKVGVIGSTGEPVLLRNNARSGDWIVKPDWAERQHIQSFAGQSLIYRGEILGVLGLFSRAALTDRDARMLRAFAGQAAVAISNCRAFAEIDRLRAELEEENRALREQMAPSGDEIIGQSAAIQRLLEQIDLVAATPASVLITGESGTGKELVARRLHQKSDRRDRPLIQVNCASVPRDLFESEFFGHVKGSFTGALRDRAGRFQAADGGTLFLDELGEIPLELQAKLLRVLQEGTFERVGEEATRSVDVRIIAATNRDLEAEVRAGRFREDLYYRLSVFPLQVPPLRERLEDVPLLAEHFVLRLCKKLGRSPLLLGPSKLHELAQYHWPGNVRELQNVIERAVILSKGKRLELGLRTAPAKAQPIAEVLSEKEMRRRERENLQAALARCGGKIYGEDGAAALLGIRPTTLASRLRALKVR